MRLQILQDRQGNNTGIFVPMEDWNIIKTNYPDIDSTDIDIPEWQKLLIDNRLNIISQNRECIKPIDELLQELES